MVGFLNVIILEFLDQGHVSLSERILLCGVIVSEIL